MHTLYHNIPSVPFTKEIEDADEGSERSVPAMVPSHEEMVPPVVPSPEEEVPFELLELAFPFDGYLVRGD